MDNEPPPSGPKGSSLQQFWRELKRRHVVRVATVYAVAGWLIIQIASATFEGFGIPEWAFRFVALMVMLGFPLALIVAWAFELTPEGIKVTPSASAREASTKPTESRRRGGWLSILFAAGLPTLIFGALALFFFFRTGGHLPFNEPTLGEREAAQAGPSVAVLPFVNMSTVEENAFFAAGVHEDILTHLSRLPGMQVISRTSVMRYGQSSLGVREIAAELGARYIVEGSVRRINNHVRVTAQLIDAANDSHLWASNYDRELVDVFATQSAVAKQITNALLLEIFPGAVDELSDMPTRSVKAYDLYLKATSIDRSEPESESSLTRQRLLLEEAVREDPAFAEAWGFLNEICDHSIRNLLRNNWFLELGTDRDAIFNELRNTAESALTKAITLDADNVETLLARASDYFRESSDPEFSDQRKEFLDEALARYPENAIVWYTLGWWHNLAGEMEAATAAFEKALVLDPLHARILYGAIIHFTLNGDINRSDQLWARLPQISTEKYTNPTLLGVFVESLFGGFYGTGDEAQLRVIAETIEKGSGHFRTDALETLYRLFLRLMQAEPSEAETLCGEFVPCPLPALLSEENQWEMQVHNAILAQICLSSGDKAKAEQISRDLVEFFQQTDLKNPSDLSFLTRVFALLGDTERARALAYDPHLVESSDYGGRVGAMSAVDLDAAAELFAEFSAENFGYVSGMAAFHLYYGSLLVHPKVKAVFVKDGRWLPYLAKRIPEYAEFRVENAP